MSDNKGVLVNKSSLIVNYLPNTAIWDTFSYVELVILTPYSFMGSIMLFKHPISLLTIIRLNPLQVAATWLMILAENVMLSLRADLYCVVWRGSRQFVDGEPAYWANRGASVLHCYLFTGVC